MDAAVGGGIGIAFSCKMHRYPPFTKMHRYPPFTKMVRVSCSWRSPGVASMFIVP